MDIGSLPMIGIPGAAPQQLPQAPAALPRIGAAPVARRAAPPPPQVGQTVEGHTYVGGDPGNPKSWQAAKGDDFLGSMPFDDNAKALIKSIASYELPPGSARGGIGSPEVQQLLGYAKQYDPTFDAKNYQAVQKARTEVGNPDSQFNKTVTALNTAIDHVAGLSGSTKALNNGNYPALNWIENKALEWSGDNRPTQYNLNRDVAADEIVKAISGGQGGGEGDRRIMEGNFSLNGSPDQQNGAISKAVQLLSSKLDELNATYSRAGNAHGNVMSLLSPSARKSWAALQQVGVSPPGGGAPNAGPAAGAAPQLHPQDIVNELRRRGVVK